MNTKRLIHSITSIFLLAMAQMLLFSSNSLAAGLLTPANSQYGTLEIG